MKNALYVHRTQGSGVEAVHINGIANNLTTLGYEVSFLSPSGENSAPKSKDTVKAEKNNAAKKKFSLVSWLSAKMPEFLFEIIEISYNLFAYIRGVNLGKYKSVDVIYERYAIFSVVGVLLAKRFKIPVILEVNYTSLSPLVRKRSPILKPLAKRFDQWVFTNATAIVAVSGALKKELITDFAIKADKIEVIANAADPNLFEVAEKPITNSSTNTCTIGFVGGFYPWHGLALLVEAVKVLVDNGQNITCVLIGDGPELANINNQVKQYNLDNHFSFLGRIEHSLLASHVATFDIGVMPDSNNYGSPMKLFEYMAAGIPFVAADYSPISEITAGQGQVFAKQNVESFVQALSIYTDNAQIRKTAGIRGRELVESKHNWVKNTERTMAHLDKTMQSKAERVA